MTENLSPVPNTVKKSAYIDEDENTTLHYAAARGDLREFKKHIENGHEIDPVNYLGWTPLMMATRNGHMKIVETLLEKSANSTLENKFGFNIVFMAIASENLDLLRYVLQFLLCGGISKQSLQNMFCPISFAVLFDNLDMVQYLIQQGFCVNVSTKMTGIKPLMFADALGNSKIIHLLLQKGGKRNRNTTPKQPVQLTDSSKRPPNVSPLIIVNQPSFNPVPQSFINFSPNVLQMPRTSSDLMSPNFSPYLTPIPQNPYVQQVFFPSNFAFTPFNSPAVNSMPSSYYDTNDFLNSRILQGSPVYSPVFNEFPK